MSFKKGLFLLYLPLFVSMLEFSLGLLEAAQEKGSAQETWERTVRAGKNEGQVVVYIDTYEAVLPAFHKAFPEIQVVGVPGRGSELVPRIMAERRSGKYVADLCICGSTTPYRLLYLGKALEPIRPALILPEVLDESKWWEGRHFYMDPENAYIFIFVGNADSGRTIAYNTKLVSAKEFKSYWDFVNPKWKGKITSRDPTVPGEIGASLRFFYYNPELGPEYLRKLFGEMNVTLFRGITQGADWLASGKYAFCFFCPDVDVAKTQGLPVDTPPPLKEGAPISSALGSLAFMNNAPHPYAAKVFINWLLSREGQTALQREVNQTKRGTVNSLRIDIPKDDVPPENRRVEGVKYVFTTRPDWMDMKPIDEIIKKALGEAQR